MNNIDKKYSMFPEGHIREKEENFIELAFEEDLEGMVEIWFQELAQDGRHLKEEAKELRLKEYKELIKNPDHFFLVCKRQNLLIGFVHYFFEKNEYETKFGEDTIGWIKTIAVSHDYKDMEIGVSLLAEAEEKIKENGIKNLYVKTREGAEYFEKRGFERFATILKKKIDSI